MDSSFLGQALVYLVAAVVAVPLAKRFGFGSVLGYLLAGMLIGPHALKLVQGDGAAVMGFAEFGVVMMLFLIGLELKPSLLWKLRAPILGLGGLQVLLTALLVMGAAFFFFRGSFGGGLAPGEAWKPALAVGLILAMSSTAIVLQSLKEKGLSQTPGGQMSFSVLLFQDLAVIPILTLMPFLAVHSVTTSIGAGGAGSTEAGHGGGSHGAALLFDGQPAWVQALALIGAVALVLVGGRFLSRPLFRAIAGTGLREAFTATALLLIVGITLLMQLVGLSPALGAFLAGVVLADSEYRHELEGDIEPFKGLLLGLFFISVGAGVDFPFIVREPALVLGVVMGVMVLKGLVLGGLSALFRLDLREGLLLSLGLCQVGEFAFVLLSLSRQLGVLGPDTLRLLTAVAALSMVLTPPLFLLLERVLWPRLDGLRAGKKGNAEGEGREAPEPMEGAPVLIAGFGRVGLMVGRILRANGVPTTVLDLNPRLLDTVRRLGLKAHYGDASRLDLLQAAGAERARLLVLALDDADKTVQIVDTVRRHFPNLRIHARVRDRVEAYSLINRGIDHVYRETQGTAMEMGFAALRELGFRGFQAKRSVLAFQRHNEAALHELARHQDDDETYWKMLRSKIDEAEGLLRDGALLAGQVDPGWDNTSLRAQAGTVEPAEGKTQAGLGGQAS